MSRRGLTPASHFVYFVCVLANVVNGVYWWARGDGFPFISLAGAFFVGALWSFQDTRLNGRAS